jgi:hypothetical protein
MALPGRVAMRRRTFWSWVYYLSLRIHWAAIASTVAVGAILKTEPQRWEWAPPLHDGFAWVQVQAWWLLLVIGIVGGIGKYSSSIAGPPWVWESVQMVLDRFRREAFRRAEEDAIHQHRVTLFKKTNWLWWVWPPRGACCWWPWGAGRGPRSGWLVPIVRSGFTTQRTNTVFLAPDDADNAEGVAGVAWSKQKVYPISKLPDLLADPSPAAIAEYARQAKVSENWIRMRLKQGKPCPRSMCGIPVEVGGDVWGVIVLDSRDGDGIKSSSHIYQAYVDMVPLFLGELLKRV